MSSLCHDRALCRYKEGLGGFRKRGGGGRGGREEGWKGQY